MTNGVHAITSRYFALRSIVYDIVSQSQSLFLSFKLDGPTAQVNKLVSALGTTVALNDAWILLLQKFWYPRTLAHAGQPGHIELEDSAKMPGKVKPSMSEAKTLCTRAKVNAIGLQLPLNQPEISAQ
ncbi:hypothetical protein N7539_008032 [Penicillium diatomitis]|uniref:Uncharacterized protein n=1 Tax=Penicillium diatomitis TaxID=2819901 RepID=A0A9W9WSZ8_9EURO|nr:uncharacterized protein N7539_008032 [Penicillium diatomitis]KAJ5474966.1 hypothetical protein N7539_008032 [Penicillium diatomitis]